MARLTIPDEPTFAEFTVTTPTTAFPITYALFAKEDLTVLVDGVALSQSNFTFSGTLLEGGGYDGGTVTLNSAVSGVDVRIDRNVPIRRASNFSPSNNVPVGSLDMALNRLTAQVQDVARVADGAADGVDEFEEGLATVVAAADAVEGVLPAIEASSAQLYLTTVSVQGLNIPGAVTAFRVHGYATAGDGGATDYIEVANAGPMLDGQITTNGGSRRWELSPSGGRVHVAQFGAFPGLHLDADTKALWNAFSTKPSLAHIRRIDFFISELKKHGVWPKVGGLYVSAAQSLSDSYLNWTAPAFAPLSPLSGTPSFIRGVGWRGAASTVQLRTMVNLSAFPGYAQNSAHIGVATRGKPVTGQSSDVNAVGAAADAFIQMTDAYAFNVRMNDKTSLTFTHNFNYGRARHVERHGQHFIVSRDNASGYSVDRSGYPLGAGTITNRTSTGVPVGPLNVYLYADSTTTNETAKVTQATHVGAALDAVDRKILYQHLRDLLTDIPAVIDGPTSTQAMVDGPSQTTTQTRQRMQAAMNFAARKGVECHLDRGVYLIDGQLFVPSRTRLRGAGMRETTIRVEETASTNHNVLILGWYDNRRSDIQISDLTCDYNCKRRASSAVAVYDPNGREILGNVVASAMSVSNCENVHLLRVGAMNAAKHCFDVTAPTYGRGLGTALIYSPEPARHVTLEECWAYQGGDDNFTTHQCEDVRIVRCVSWSPQGSYVGENTNCFEIDEGSRNVSVIDSLGYGGTCGLQVKGHSDSPAPYGIHVRGCRFINNINAIELRQTGWYGPASAAQTELDTIRAPDGSQYLSSSVSPTGRNVTISDCFLIAPCVVPDMNYARDPGAATGIVLWQRAYEDVLYNNIVISEGLLDVAEDYWMAKDLGQGTGVVRVYEGGRNTQFNNLTITGFDYLDIGLYFASSLDGPASVRGFNCINGPKQAFYSLADDVQLESYAIIRDREPAGEATSVAITMNGARNHLGMGRITGYDTKLVGSPSIVAVQKTGTFVPTIYGATTPGTSSGTKAGTFSKTGREVTVNVQIAVSSYTGTGGTFVGNLPYPVSAGSVNRTAIAYGYYNGMALPAGEWPLGYAVEGTNTIRLLTGDAATANDPTIETEVTADFELYVTVTYLTDDPFPD